MSNEDRSLIDSVKNNKGTLYMGIKDPYPVYYHDEYYGHRDNYEKRRLTSILSNFAKSRKINNQPIENDKNLDFLKRKLIGFIENLEEHKANVLAKSKLKEENLDNPRNLELLDLGEKSHRIYNQLSVLESLKNSLNNEK